MSDSTLPADTLVPTSESVAVDAVVERVERLLVRHTELQRTNALLREQLDATELERESLKSRLSAARSRVDALIERLPPAPGTDVHAAPNTTH